MKYKNVLLILLIVFFQSQAPIFYNALDIPVQNDSGNVYGQEHSAENDTTAVEASNATDRSNVLYTVMAVVLIIWLGLSMYLFKIDRSIKELEKELE